MSHVCMLIYDAKTSQCQMLTENADNSEGKAHDADSAQGTMLTRNADTPRNLEHLPMYGFVPDNDVAD